MSKHHVSLKHPAWSKNAVIYQVNIRQYSAAGTFNAFAENLSRLKNLGVDILLLMPVQPIGVQNRKGTLGSEYSIRDYYGINPEFGTMEDFKSLVTQIHALGMYVILDWVANHSSWDNALATEHPEWYSKTKEGNFQPTPWYDWDDVIDFDYHQPGLRHYMQQAMEYWITETGIDGYRCDVAGFIPTDFWNEVRKALDRIRPVFMLAEWESRDLHEQAFDMTYSWSLYDKLHLVTTEKKDFAGLVEYLAHDVNTFPEEAYRMTFTENHDKNTWTGTAFMMFGEGLQAAIAFTFIVKGMPLIYSGQEAGNKKQLSFFDKDQIVWKDDPLSEFYKTLIEIKHRNEALWNGAAGGGMNRIYNDCPDQVISFYREKNNDLVVSAFNFSDHVAAVQLRSPNSAGQYNRVFTNQPYQLKGNDSFILEPWAFIILEKIAD